MTNYSNDNPATINVVGGNASVVMQGLALRPGVYFVTGDYLENAHYQHGSDTSTVTINKHPSSTSLSLSTNTCEIGESIVITVNVTSGATGTVTIYEDGTPILFNQTLTNSSVQISYTPSSVGSHTLYAVYSGDNDYQSSQSSSTSMTCTLISTTLTVSSPSTTVSIGGTWSATVQVKNKNNSNINTGTLNIYEDNILVATVTKNTINKSVSFTTSSLGNHTVRIEYVANGNYAGSTSSNMQYTCVKRNAPYDITLFANEETSVTVNSGTSVTFRAYLGQNNVSYAASYYSNRTYTVYDNGTAVLTNQQFPSNTYNPTFTYTPTGAGSHTIYIVADETSTINSKQSTSVTVNVRKSTSITVNNVYANQGDSTSITASIKDGDNQNVTSGSATLYIDNTSIDTQTVSNGSVTFSYNVANNMTTGSHTIRVDYAENNTYASGSGNATLQVRIPTTLTVNDVTATQGDTTTITINVKDENNNDVPNGTVTVDIT